MISEVSWSRSLRLKESYIERILTEKDRWIRKSTGEKLNLPNLITMK